MHYSGLDAHSKSCELDVVDEEGKLVQRSVFGTSERELIKRLEGIPRPNILAVEETTLAGWVYRVAKDHVGRVVVCDPRENKWIARSAQKSDRIDAFKLAQLLRGGFLKAVYHPEDDRQRFKELVLHYHTISREVARTKNRIKAKLRQNAIVCSGDGVYDARRREKYLVKLSASEARFQLKCLWKILDVLEEMKKRGLKEVARKSKRYSEVKMFREVPGVGLVTAATVSAIVATPFRFETKKKLWSYSGLGLKNSSSDSWEGPKSLNRQANRLLKYVVRIAAKEAVFGCSHENKFGWQYRRLVESGVAPGNAINTVARSILAAMYGMWKSGEAYRPI